MKKLIRSSITALFSLLSPVFGAPLDLHLASNGDDQFVGTSEHPFTSLERARDNIRGLKKSGEFPEGGVTVWMHACSYIVAFHALGSKTEIGASLSPIS